MQRIPRVPVFVSLTIFMMIGGCSTAERETFAMLGSPEEPTRYRATVELSKAVSGQSTVALNALRARLGDPSPRIRIAAARGISGAAGEGVVADLSRLLSDEIPEVRSVAVEELVRLGDEAAMTTLLATTRDRDPEIRELTRQALVELGLDGREQVAREAAWRRSRFVKQAESSVWSRRLQATRELADCGDGEAIETLLGLLDDRDPDVAKTAARGVGRAFHEVSPGHLRDVLEKTPDTLHEHLLKGMIEAPYRSGIEGSGMSKLCADLTSPEIGRLVAQVVTTHRIACDIASLEHVDETEGAVVTVLLSKAPQMPELEVQRAADALWRTARGEDLIALTTLAGAPPSSATKRIHDEVERYLMSSERWIPAPDREEEAPAHSSPEIENEEEHPPGSEGRAANALRDLLSQYPVRQRGWIEMFPSTFDTDELVTLLLVAGEVGVVIDEDVTGSITTSAPDPQVRAAGVWAGGGGIEFLQSESAQIRAVAAEALHRDATRLDGPTKARLAFILADHEASVRAAAATTLAASRDPAAVNPLLAAFRRWHEPGVACALGDLGQHDGAAPLAEALGQPIHRANEDLVVAILGALARIGSEEHSEEIAPYLSDPRPEVRGAALRAARAIGGSRLSSLADERTHDFALSVREVASLTDE